MAAICIVAHNAFGAIAGTPGHIGGVERQTAMLAKFLASTGHDVNFVTWDEGYEEIEQVAGVRIIRVCSESAGVPGLRFFVPRWSSLRRRLKQAASDLYYQNGAEYVTGQVAHFCRQAKRRFVFSAASDTDCDRDLPELPTLRERLLYRYGLKNADCRIVQTANQKSALLDDFGLESVILPMPCALESSRLPIDDTGNAAVALWVGRIVPTKRLELLLEVAHAVPDVTFRIVGGSDDDTTYADEVISQAKQMPNVTYLGELPFDLVQQQFADAQLFICTSMLEGFPNTFLEAWANGLPVVTTFDPDGLIAARGLGAAVHDVAGLVRGTRQFAHNAQMRKLTAERCCRYFEDTHSHDAALARFEDLFNKILRSGKH